MQSPQFTPIRFSAPAEFERAQYLRAISNYPVPAMN